MQDNFYYNFYTNLLAVMPKDTGNMLSSTKMYEDYENFYVLITAKNKNYDYARSVNYGLKAKADNRPMTFKEMRNYMFVENCLKQASILTGGSYELY